MQSACSSTCNNEECSDSTSLLQVRQPCAPVHQDPFAKASRRRHDVYNHQCCHGLTRIKSKFTSDRCSFKCFACSTMHEDPMAQCHHGCGEDRCHVPCCAGLHQIKGPWRQDGTCSFRCTCSERGVDVNAYCEGRGNTCGGSCHIPCCSNLMEVERNGKWVCEDPPYY